MQVSYLLEERRGRGHSSTTGDSRSLPEIQNLMDRLNNEASLRSTLEIQLVNITNENTTLKSTVQDLNSTISKLEFEIRGLGDEAIVIRKELESSNQMSKSGYYSIENENQVLKAEIQKISN